MGLVRELAAARGGSGVKAVSKGETGGFPLIIYSLSLGNRAVSAAKLSLLAPGPFEAGGCLSSLSGCTAPALSLLSKPGRGRGLSKAPAHMG